MQSQDFKDVLPYAADGKKPSREGWEGSEFLPGIPDEITIHHILTKVSWQTLYAGASVNRFWKKKMRSGEIYDARVRANSTQTLVAIVHMDPVKGYSTWNQAISLYDSDSNTWHLLPPLPGICNRVPWACGCVSFLGKLYILGGWGKDPPHGNEVYYFDVSGQSGWRQCASMKDGRRSFACEVKDGKIYAFGGTRGAEEAGPAGFASEVYDPVNDVWCSIAPMISNRTQHKVAIYGDELYVQVGRLEAFASPRRYGHFPQFAEVYNPRKDEWRKVDNFTTNNDRTEAAIAEVVVMIDGRLHKILDDALLVYEDSSQLWKQVQSISWEVLQRGGSSYPTNFLAQSSSAVVTNGELVALVHCQVPGRKNYAEVKPLRSEGLGRKDQQISWKKIRCSFQFDSCHRLCTILL